MRQTISRKRDRQFVQRLIQRDKSAWESFVASYYSLICARIERTAAECRFILVRAEVEDICSEVLQTLVSKEMATLRSFQGTSTLSTWLCVIARRICMKHLNKRPLDRGIGTQPNQLDAMKSENTPDAIAGLIQKEEFQKLNKLMGELKSTDRQVLNLYFAEELTYHEIGQRMEISENAVGPKLYRAQQRLKKLFRRQEHA